MADYTYDEVITALRNADAAGDTEAASQLARIANGMSSAKPSVKVEPIDYNKTAEELPWYQQLAAGAGGAVEGLRLGAKQLIPGLAKPTEQEVQDYQAAMSGLRNTGWGLTGEIAANILPGGAVAKGITAIPKIGNLIRAGGLASGATIAGTGAATGGVQGALIPTTADQSRAENIRLNALIGGVAPAAVGTLGYFGKKALRPVVQNLSKQSRAVEAGRILRSAAGGGTRADELQQALSSPTPGLLSSQNVAQRAISAGIETPRVGALQEIIDSYTALPARTLSDIQEQSRLKALRSIGKDMPGPDAPKPHTTAQIVARNNAADKLYEEARLADELRIANEQALKLQTGPSGVSLEVAPHPAVARVLSGDTSVAQNLRGVAAQIARDFPELGSNPASNIMGLHQMKLALDSDISAILAGRPTALRNATERSLLDAKDKLLGAMKEVSPKYDVARRIYSEMSVPIDQMRVGQVLEDALASTVKGGAERASVFANKIKAAAQIIKRTTGQARYDSLSKLFTPEQMAIVDNVLRELEVDVTQKGLAKTGMAEQVRLMGVTASENPIPNVMNTAITLSNNVIMRALKRATNLTLVEMSEIMQDPKKAAAVMAKASRSEKNALMLMRNMQMGTAVGSPAITKGLQ